MLRRVKELQGYTMGARDGDIGTIEDVYFDDQSWTVRHLVLDTGGWLTGRRVLIPPCAVERVESTTRRLVTSLSRQQVEESPGLDSARPVSRRYEQDLYGYYGYPYYWTGPYLWGPIMFPSAPPPNSYEAERRAAAEPTPSETHLRSARDVIGHGIQATDGALGHVEDFVVDEETWGVRYMVVDPRNWWPGHHVIVPTEWITAVHWNDSTVQVDVDKEAVRSAPRYDPSVVLDRDYEARYHESFGRSGYWERRPESWKRYPPAA